MWIMFASTKSELLDRSKGKKNLKCKFAQFHKNIWAWTLSARNVTVNQDQMHRTGVIIYDPWIEGLHFRHADL